MIKHNNLQERPVLEANFAIGDYSSAIEKANQEATVIECSDGTFTTVANETRLLSLMEKREKLLSIDPNVAAGWATALVGTRTYTASDVLEDIAGQLERIDTQIQANGRQPITPEESSVY